MAEQFSRKLGEDILEKIEYVHSLAKAELVSASASPINVVSTTPGIQDSKDPNAEFANERDRRCLVLRRVIENPLIARVEVEYGKGQRKVFYISSTNPGCPVGANVAGYHAPIGQLVEYEVGDECRVNGVLYEILNKQHIDRCCQDSNLWDALDVKDFEWERIETIASIRRALSNRESPEDVFSLIAGKEDFDSRLKAHRVIDKIGIRRQAILDKFQGSIFRMPLASQVVVLGPPGTGKTTTLV